MKEISVPMWRKVVAQPDQQAEWSSQQQHEEDAALMQRESMQFLMSGRAMSSTTAMCSTHAGAVAPKQQIATLMQGQVDTA